MTTQPEALRLAEVAPYLEVGERGQWIMSAADELRRLHESHQELLEALKEVYTTCDWHGDDGQEAMMKARVAINKAERTTP
jgi:DNA-binding ferritin-like protein